MKSIRQYNKNQPNSKKALSRLGGVVVEFAIVVPLFLLFLFAAIEFGRLNMVRHMVDNAAYEAARNAMVPGATTQEAIDEGNRVLALTGITGAQIQISTVQLGEAEEEENGGLNLNLNLGGLNAGVGVGNNGVNVGVGANGNGLEVNLGNQPPPNEQIDDETIQVTVTVSVPFAVNALLSPVFSNDAVIVRSATLKTERYFGIQ